MNAWFLRSLTAGLLISSLAGAAGDSSNLGGQATAVIHSASQQNIESSNIHIDNQLAYQAKIDLIKSARKSIRLAYYIYSDDETSSYLTRLIIDKAANEGVKVDLLVDLHTNYSRMDLFRMMEQKGKGNLTVHFFNRPTPSIIRDVTFMTATCSATARANEAECRAERKAQANQAYQEALRARADRRAARLPFMTQLFLAGLYSKSGGPLQISLSVGTGADLKEIADEIKKGNGPGGNEADLEQLKSLLKLVFQAKVLGSAQAKLQLAVAMSLYGEKIQPILDMIDKAVPDTMNDEFSDNDAWVHVTDFLHHKFLLVDDQFIQIGGRNIENSYHLNRIAGAGGKYIFRDTDLSARLRSPNTGLALSYDRMFNFSPVVTSLAETQLEFNSDLVAKTPLAVAGIIDCQKAPSRTEKVGCIERAYRALPESGDQALGDAFNRMNSRADSNLTRDALAYSGSRFNFFTSTLGAQDLANSYLAYLENIPYDKFGPTNPTERLYFQKDRLAQSEQSKHIHNVVKEGLLRVCAEATRAFSSARNKAAYLNDPANRRRISIHQGYTIFPGEVFSILGRAVNPASVNGGSMDLHCPNVEIEILTNSIPTTDLSIINLFAGLQIGSLIDQQRRSMAYYQSSQDEIVKARLFPPPEIRYYEFQSPRENSGLDTESLHTKVFVFDKAGLFIGSANADVRSYYMDTNNGIFIGNAPLVNQHYFDWIDSQKAQDPSGRPFYLELTQQVAAQAHSLSVLESGDPATTKKARTEALKAFFQVEVEKVAAHFEKKWREKSASMSPEELRKLEERIAKMRHYLPSITAGIATVNLYVYDVSLDLIANQKSSQELTEIERQFNLRFELL